MFSAIVLFLLLAIVFGVGFALDALWLAAIVMLALWVLGLATRGARRSWSRW